MHVSHRDLMKRLIQLRLVLALVVLALSSQVLLHAGVTVYPTEVFVKPPNRSAPVVVSNPADADVEVWVTFEYTYPVGFDTGSVIFAAPVADDLDEPSAARWIRAIPQRFTLKAQESQVVRIYGTPPPGTRSGEYWARIVVSSKERRAAPAPGDQPGMGMELVTQTIVPFHFRSGPTTSGINIREATAFPVGNALRLFVTLDRMGNASFWGRLTARLISPEGRPVLAKEYRIVTYKSFYYRTDIDVSGQPPGQYTLELLFDNKHPGLKPEFRIPGAPVVHRIPVVIP